MQARGCLSNKLKWGEWIKANCQIDGQKTLI